MAVRKQRFGLALSASLVALGGGAGAGYAQVGPAVAAPPSDAGQQSSQANGDIVVTAQRRTERLQDVPIAVSAFSGATIARAGISSTADLPTITPGLNWTQSLSSATPYIRGVGTNDASVGNESSNALYVDGFYYPSLSGAIFALSNIERIEVLKGPQGTLFGRNATGGLIQIITRDPSATPHLDAKIGYSNFDTFEGSAYATTGLGGSAAGDVAVYYSNQAKGWGQSITVPGAQVNKAETFSIRSKIKANVGPIDVTLVGDYTSRRGNIGLTRNFLPGAFSLGKLRGFDGSIYDGPTSPATPSNKQGGLGLRLETELPFARLVSLTGVREVHDHASVDQDGTPVEIQTVEIRSKDRAITQELQLVSSHQSKLNWIVGGFFFDRKAQYDPTYVHGTALPPVFGGSFQIFDEQHTRSYAAYGQGTLEVLPSTHLTLGIRYTSDTQTISGQRTAGSGLITPYPETQITFSKVTWRGSLDHKFGPDVLGYVSVNRGYKAGLFNATNPSDPPAGPEVLEAYEAGLKTTLLDHTLILNVSGFIYDYKGLQLQRVVGPFTQTYNATSASVHGLDLDATLRPAKGLSILMGATLLPRSRYLDFPNAPSSSPNPAGGNIIVPGDASGHQMIRASKATFNISANYEFEIGNGRIITNATAFRSGKFYWDPDNRVSQGAYTLVNAQIGWMSRNSRYGVRLWVKNIGEARYYTFVNTSAYGDTGTPGAPRTFGVSLETHL